ncbi:hypothetical protein EYV94_19975 [Puteibacter caeruleilacunae]|nr:hypothetical protein EYV94_19975 [Puteibacter caeruleilacunae]
MIKIFYRFVTSSFTRVLGLGLNFLVIIVVGELLEAGLSSLFFQTQSFILILLSVVRFGSEDYLLRKASSSEGKYIPSFVANKWFFIQNGLVCLLLFFGANLFFKLDIFNSIVIALYGVIYNYGFYSSVLFQGAKHYNRASISMFIFPPLLILVGVLLGFVDDLSHLYSISIIGILLGLLLSRLNQGEAPNLIKFSLPNIVATSLLGLSTIGGEILRNAPILLSKVSLGPEETVKWTYSIKIVQLCTIFVMLLNYYYAPRIRELFLSHGKLGVSTIFKEQLKLSMLASVGIVIAYIFLYFLLEKELMILIGILLPGYIVSLMFSSIGYMLIMMGKEVINAVSGGVVILLYILAFIILKEQSIYVMSAFVSVGVFLPKLISFLYYKYAL